MTVRELKKILEQYPDDMQVLTERYSDYVVIEPSEFSIIGGVPDASGWVMRSHPTMSDDHKRREKKYLLLEGNQGGC